MIGVARRLVRRRRRSSALDLELPVMSMDAAALARLIREHAHRCRRQLPRRAAGRPRQRHRRRASRFRRAAAAGDPRQRPRDPPGPYLDSRRRRRGPHRLQHHQARGRAADRGFRHSLRDPAAGLCGRAVGLWRQRHAARAGGVSARSAGRRAGHAVPAGRGGGYRRDHRLARRRAISTMRRERRDAGT